MSMQREFFNQMSWLVWTTSSSFPFFFLELKTLQLTKLLWASHPSSYTVFGEFVLSYSNFQVILAKNTF